MSAAAAPRAGNQRDRFTRIRAQSEALAAPLSPEDCAAQSMPDASPVKWHLAHTTWFFETFVLERAPGYAPFHPQFRAIFNSYYNAVGPQHARPQRGLLTRPDLETVRAFRRHVDERMLALLDAPRALAPELAEIVEIGLHHEQQHQELILTDVLHLFSRSPLHPAYRAGGAPARPDAKPTPLRWHRHAGGLVEIGHAGPGFAFDNEGPRHAYHLAPFELASRLVTNAEYRAFQEDGGYERPELWLSDGWARREADGWRAPLYWEAHGGRWHQLGLDGLRELHPDEPVCHVSFYEADAYARWAGARLPTEQEWEAGAAPLPVAGNFVESGVLAPAGAPEPDGAPVQMFGDCWEWTRSPYCAYPGYKPAAGALGEYNGKFMANQIVLRGGSCATPGDHVRASYRNFFFPDARWQWSGIRLARDLR
jgi:ergothioneine biosynthesis protein EgtB